MSEPNESVLLFNSHRDTDTSGMVYSSGGEGKITPEMKQQATFQNWDFSTILSINEGNEYPKLRWQ